MWTMVATFFGHLVAASNPLWWYYPLCAIVALVYKATKHDSPLKILTSAIHFFVVVTLGMFALALALYLIQVIF
jgi:hypothetical protein